VVVRVNRDWIEEKNDRRDNLRRGGQDDQLQCWK
jgi:hypothetical protein